MALDMIEPGANVLLVAHSQYRGLYVGVARLLKERCDASVHLYAATAQEAEFYRTRFADVFSSITVARALYETCREPAGEATAVIARARENERALNTTYNALALSDRHLGRGFALGGFKHPRSRISEDTSYLQMLNAFNVVVDFWRGALARHKPSLVIGAGKPLCVLCRQSGIPVRIIAGSRFRSYYYWSANEFREHPGLAAAFAAAAPNAALTLEQPYAAHLKNRERMRRAASLQSTVRSAGMSVARHAYWTMRGFDKAKGYYLRENIAMDGRFYRDTAMLDTAPNATLDEIAAAGPYVFFPLATEPETALQTISPEYFFQLEAIATLARDLPAGVTLAVKEHYAAIGRRPTDFYRQITEFKNVRMMRVSEFGLEAVRKSAAVATISGTAGFEGAALGKPVISFGIHNIYNIVPHVHVVDHATDLTALLGRLILGGFDEPAAQREGTRFLQAIVDSSFDLAGFAPSQPDRIDAAAVDAAFSHLVSGLSDSATTGRAEGAAMSNGQVAPWQPR